MPCAARLCCHSQPLNNLAHQANGDSVGDRLGLQETQQAAGDQAVSCAARIDDLCRRCLRQKHEGWAQST